MKPQTSVRIAPPQPLHGGIVQLAGHLALTQEMIGFDSLSRFHSRRRSSRAERAPCKREVRVRPPAPAPVHSEVAQRQSTGLLTRRGASPPAGSIPALGAIRGACWPGQPPAATRRGPSSTLGRTSTPTAASRRHTGCGAAAARSAWDREVASSILAAPTSFAGCGAARSALVWGTRGRGGRTRQPDHSRGVAEPG